MNEFEVADPKLIAIINTINISVRKFSSLIKDMSVIGKIETGMLNLESIDLTEIIDDIKISIHDKIFNTKAIITTDFKIKTIYFSKKNLRSILYNLVNNAIKFKNGKKIPEINITSGRKNKLVFISVTDNGIGIAKKDIPNIFQIHGRLHQDIEGNGMGLFLIKKIVDTSGGNIVVESRPGKGSTFTIFFKS